MSVIDCVPRSEQSGPDVLRECPASQVQNRSLESAMSRRRPTGSALHKADVGASRTVLWYEESVSVKIVTQPNTFPLHTPRASQSECVTPFHRFEKRFTVARDKWVNNEPNLIDQSSVEEA